MPTTPPVAADPRNTAVTPIPDPPQGTPIHTLEPLGLDERGALIDVANPPEWIGRMVMAQLDLDIVARR